MQHSIHPKYQPVVFEDTSCNQKFLISSCLTSEKTVKWEDGNEYPHVFIDVSSASHPFYTGERRSASSEGRIAKFQKRFSTKLSTKKTS